MSARPRLVCVQMALNERISVSSGQQNSATRSRLTTSAPCIRTWFTFRVFRYLISKSINPSLTSYRNVFPSSERSRRLRRNSVLQRSPRASRLKNRWRICGKSDAETSRDIYLPSRCRKRNSLDGESMRKQRAPSHLTDNEIPENNPA